MTTDRAETNDRSDDGRNGMDRSGERSGSGRGRQTGPAGDGDQADGDSGPAADGDQADGDSGSPEPDAADPADSTDGEPPDDAEPVKVADPFDGPVEHGLGLAEVTEASYSTVVDDGGDEPDGLARRTLYRVVEALRRLYHAILGLLGGSNAVPGVGADERDGTNASIVVMAGGSTVFHNEGGTTQSAVYRAAARYGLDSGIDAVTGPVADVVETAMDQVAEKRERETESRSLGGETTADHRTVGMMGENEDGLGASTADTLAAAGERVSAALDRSGEADSRATDRAKAADSDDSADGSTDSSSDRRTVDDQRTDTNLLDEIVQDTSPEENTEQDKGKKGAERGNDE